MEVNNEDQFLNNLLDQAIDKTISDLKNAPVVRKIIISKLTDSEIAEISLYHEGECSISDKTSTKIDKIWREILSVVDPALYDYLKNRK